MLVTSYTLKELLDRPHIFQHVTGDNKRRFVSFDTLQEFESWYLNLDLYQRKVFEVIRDGPQKLKFDIDGKHVSKHTLIRDIEIICHRVREFLPTARPLVYDISDENITSFHVIFDDVYFYSTSDTATFASHIAYDLKYVDFAVYNQVQFFRCEGSTKPGQTRFKKLFGHQDFFSWGVLPGLVTYTDNCVPVNMSEVFSKEITLRTHPMYRKRMSDCIINNTPEPLEFTVLNNFRIRRSQHKDSLIIALDRLRPYNCFACGSIHDNENPYLKKTFDPYTQKESLQVFTFVCRRTGKSCRIKCDIPL